MACFDAWDIGGCGCGGGFLVTCKGCGSIPLAGDAIQVWTSSGGTLISTLTANGSGQITLGAGTYWLISSSGRLNGANVTVAANMPVTFGAATGYQCIAGSTGCMFPLKTTLYWTDSVFGGPHALTFSLIGGPTGGPGWSSGSIAVTGPTCCSVPGVSHVSALIGVAGQFEVAAGGNILADNTMACTCPPSFSYTKTFTNSGACIGGGAYYSWCSASITETVTE
jgi:hypothetical protein